MLYPKNVSREERLERAAWSKTILDEIEKLLTGEGLIERRGTTLHLEGQRRGRVKPWTVAEADSERKKVLVRNHEDQKKWLAPNAKKIADQMKGMMDPSFIHHGKLDKAEKEEGKTSSLRSDVIRLAHQKPELREHLLPLVKKR